MINQAIKLSGLSGFGIISAYVDGKDCGCNALRSDIYQLGLRITEFNGHWEGIPERSFITFGIKLSDLINLGKKYKQSAVIFCPRGGEPGLVHL